MQISIAGHKIDETDHTKFVGAVIDSKLAWEHHIFHIAGKIAKGIGVITEARKLIDKDTLIALYYTFIYPYLCYCNHVSGHTYMMENCIWSMRRVKPRTHTKALFGDAKILNIFQIAKYIIGTFMFIVYKSHKLNIFTSKFACNSSIHAHDTRQSDHFHVPMI